MSRKLVLKTIMGAATLLAASLSEAKSPSDWVQGLPVETGVYTELQKFRGLPSNYIQNFPNIMKQRIMAEFAQATRDDLANQSCRDQLNINFLNQVTDAASDNRIRDFESQFIRIEAKSCLNGVQASRAAAIYLSPEYQKSAFDTVRIHDQQGNRICQTTETFGLGRSQYCYNNSVLENADATFIHSLNDWNQDNIAAPVFYREIFTASIGIPQGTLFYTLVYVRGVSLNSLFKTLAKSKIRSSQQQAMELLSSMSRAQ